MPTLDMNSKPLKPGDKVQIFDNSWLMLNDLSDGSRPSWNSRLRNDLHGNYAVVMNVDLKVPVMSWRHINKQELDINGKPIYLDLMIRDIPSGNVWITKGQFVEKVV